MKKRVLFLIPNLMHGGAERVLVNLVNNMDTTRFDVTLQTLFDIGVNKADLKDTVRYIGGWKHIFRGNSQIMKVFSPAFLYKTIVEPYGPYDIIVSYLEGPSARIIAGCQDTKTKKVAWIHIELNTPRLAAVGFRTIKEAKEAYRRYDAIVAVSKEVKKCFSDSLQLSKELHVIYNTNETELIREKALLAPDVKEFKYGSGLTVCSVAKLYKVKGFDRLLNAHKRLMDDGLLHKVYILGIGEEEKALRVKIREYGVEDSFILLGFRDNPYQYVSRCDLYVCSSRREGFSTAVTESLIVGTPVVSTDCSGARELLGNHDEYGLVVENSEEGIYQGMKKMLSDPALLAHYREKAKERGKSFSREQTVKAVEDMLDRL